MYIRSPMENYNKNNPFIIIAKKVYDNIIDTIHLFGKKCIRLTILSILFWIIYSSVECYNIYLGCNHYILSIIKILITLAINISIIIDYRSKIEYFISRSPFIQEFDRLSRLEVSDIIALNNEELLKCVYGLYELRGEINTTIKYYRYYFLLCVCIEFVLIII